MGGGGNGEFQFYTNNRSNSYVRNGTLFLKPTLTADKFGEKQVSGEIPTIVDLWGGSPADLCTSNAYHGCVRGSGGGSVLNPIASARLRTVNSFSFKYGRLEIQAKLPKGDWLWPAVWMLPEHQAYGAWPASGEIDLVESRGNHISYPAGGNNCFRSIIHFGPYWPDDPFVLAEKCLEMSLNDDFHTYGLYWSKDYIYTYLDNDANRVLDMPINQSFWQRGGWDKNPSLRNPWTGQSNVAPFDQKFYIVLNLAVGGINYFPANVGGRPWAEGSLNAMADFHRALDTTVKSWDLEGDESALQVRSVKVWQ